MFTRCTYCDDEDLFSEREIRNIQKDNKNDPECDIRVVRELCNNGYQIPIQYNDKQGKLYLYDKIKPNITNPDPKNGCNVYMASNKTPH